MTILSLLMAPQGQGNPMSMVIMMVGFIAIIYFIMIRPQRKQQQEHQAMVKALKRGDEVVTVGGIIGKVVHLTNEQVTVQSGDTRIEIERAKVARVSVKS